MKIQLIMRTKKTTMNPEIKEKWCQALESGEYKQGTGRLRVGNEYCCLGVLADLATRQGVIPSPALYGSEYQYDGSAFILGGTIVVWASNEDDRFKEDVTVQVNGKDITLASLNDSGEYSFIDIARIIREQL